MRLRIMDVKDIRNTDAGKSAQNATTKSSQLQKSLRSLSAQSVDTSRAESVRVNVESRPRSNETNESRRKVNSVISAINYAAEATNEIEKLVKSVDGILEQAGSSEVPEQRTKVLEREANELVEEVRKKAQSQAPDGSRPLAGDKVELKELDKVLEVILPDDATNAFGIGPIQLSTKDAIIQTRQTVREALGRIQDLQNVVNQSKNNIGEAVAQIDVAIANQEASESSVRDVDKALSKVNDLGGQILSDPDRALSSVGSLEQSSARKLLE